MTANYATVRATLPEVRESDEQGNNKFLGEPARHSGASDEQGITVVTSD